MFDFESLLEPPWQRAHEGTHTFTQYLLSDRLYLSLSIVPAFVQEIRACEVEVVSLLSNHIQ